jgi:UDP-glucose 4-epimerase
MEVVWITGAKGFLGRTLAAYARAQGARVLGIGHGAWSEVEAAAHGVDFWLNGELDESNFKILIEEGGPPDAVFHLAGGSSVGPSLRNPLEDFRRTVATTARLYDWVRETSLDTAIVCASSAAVYGDGHSGPIPESAAPAPCSPYGMHKLMMEEIARSYGYSFGIRSTAVRLFSVYGPGQEKQLFWDLALKLARGDEPVALGGTGNEQRSWVHVEDAVRYLWHARPMAAASVPVINGGGFPASVRRVVSLFAEGWGHAGEICFTGQSRPGDPVVLVADGQRLTAAGMRAVHSPELGVPAVARSHRQHLTRN